MKAHSILTVDFAVVAAAVKGDSDLPAVVHDVVVNPEVVAPLGSDDACVRHHRSSTYICQLTHDQAQEPATKQIKRIISSMYGSRDETCSCPMVPPQERPTLAACFLSPANVLWPDAATDRVGCP